MLPEIQVTIRQPDVKNTMKALYFQFPVGVLPLYTVTFAGYWTYGSSTSTYLMNNVNGPVWAKALANITAFLQSVIALHVMLLSGTPNSKFEPTITTSSSNVVPIGNEENSPSDVDVLAAETFQATTPLSGSKRSTISLDPTPDHQLNSPQASYTKMFKKKTMKTKALN